MKIMDKAVPADHFCSHLLYPMKTQLSCLLGILFLTTAPIFAATVPATNPAPAAPTPPPAPAPAGSKFDDYINELGATLKLSEDEKKSIRSYYEADGNLLANTLNNDSLSALQKAQQVSDMRDARNAKINTLLHDSERQAAFSVIEAKYRVSLTELAANGGLIPPPAAPTPAPAAATPATNAPAAAK